MKIEPVLGMTENFSSAIAASEFVQVADHRDSDLVKSVEKTL
jgi:hypothetical protein